MPNGSLLLLLAWGGIYVCAAHVRRLDLRLTMKANMVWIDGAAYAPGHRKVREYYAKIKTENDAQPVGGLVATEPQQNKVRPLVRKPSARKSGKGGVVIIVAIQPYVHRAVDDDNFGSGAYKNLRDGIARSLGVDDGDSRIKFEYLTPIITTGATGTQILISKL